MKHLALFNGIGGFQLAAHWLGWENIAHVEIDEFCNKVVAHHFPQSKCHTDIKQFNGKEYNGSIDIISGGFPCQPYSAAGKRLGKEDDRHLWPEMLRTIREVQPTWVVGENVRGLTNWNGGMVFDEVQSDFEAEGYEVTPFLLPAAAVNAPHRRDRIWFVAYSDLRRQLGDRSGKEGLKRRTRRQTLSKSNGAVSERDATNTNLQRWEERGELCESSGEGEEKHGRHDCQSTKRRFTSYPKRLRSPRKEYWQTESRQPTKENQGQRWQNFPTQSPIRSGDDGFSDRLDGITFPKWRNESIKAYGNAIVPQVAYEIFKVIDSL
jgi:DNA (cytosine-5)-methyltransferase 1